MALLGYARVSTSHQKLTVQITELKSVGVRDDRIFTDIMSGATDEREGLQRLLARAEKTTSSFVQRWTGLVAIPQT